MSGGPHEPELTTLTNTRILDGLKDPANRSVWQAYHDRYRPLLIRYALRVGLCEPDAEDVAQQTLIEFCRSYQAGNYDRDRARLRDWLFGIARNQLRNWRRRRPREKLVSGGADESGLLANLRDEREWDDLWEREWRDAMLQLCLTEVRERVDPHTFHAFELFATQGWSAEQVAAHLAMSRNAVFIAKHRVLKYMRELLPTLDDS